MLEVLPLTTAEQRKEAWSHVTYEGPSPSAEFHGPDDFFWNGVADCKWDAKDQGWRAWLEGRKVEDPMPNEKFYKNIICPTCSMPMIDDIQMGRTVLACWNEDCKTPQVVIVEALWRNDGAST